MADGRTSWWPHDAARHRRELHVELGDEFGSDGPFLVDVLWCWAQEQRGAGVVRGGFRTLARECFVTVSHAQSIVARAAEIGLLDDLEIDTDGRRFTCRASGWQSDSERGRAALRQAAKRNREPEETVTDRDTVTPGHASSRDVTPSPLPDHREGESEGTRASADPLSAHVVDVLGQCPRLHVEPVGVENAIAAWPGRDHIRAAHTVVTWATDPAFRSTNAARLLADALSKQTPEKTAAVDAKTDRTDRRLRSLRSLPGDVA